MSTYINNLVRIEIRKIRFAESMGYTVDAKYARVRLARILADRRALVATLAFDTAEARLLTVGWEGLTPAEHATLTTDPSVQS